MDKVILAIGGVVIKTAWEELKEVVRSEKVEILVHNGASLFHDFQRATDKILAAAGMHSYPLDDLLINRELDRPAANLVWSWIRGAQAPEASVTRICEEMKIPTLCFTALGCDFWQLFDRGWDEFAQKTKRDLAFLANRMVGGQFHYLLLGSAVIHPEIFRSAMALAKPGVFRADVVDFKDMYRPRTRVARYGSYYQTDFKTFLRKWLNEDKVMPGLDFQDVSNH